MEVNPNPPTDMKDSKIEWCDHTVNFWWGCTKVSPGCAHCYADSLSNRFGKDVWGPGKPREDHRAGAIKLAMRLNREAEKARAGAERDSEEDLTTPTGYRRTRVFCSSMADWLDPEVPIEWLADLLKTVCETPNLDWLLLTKRPHEWLQRMVWARNFHANGKNGGDFETWEMLIHWIGGHFPPNVWIGTTVEDQRRADERIPELLRIPARVRFLSCEPLLGPLDLKYPAFNGADSLSGIEGIHWLICGGESGHNARPMDPDWAMSLRDQCRNAGVPFFMKQMGGTKKPFPAIPDDLNIKEFPV